jgi:hypothetical protein
MFLSYGRRLILLTSALILKTDVVYQWLCISDDVRIVCVLYLYITFYLCMIRNNANYYIVQKTSEMSDSVWPQFVTDNTQKYACMILYKYIYKSV